jgi:hypothetical protein
MLQYYEQIDRQVCSSPRSHKTRLWRKGVKNVTRRFQGTLESRSATCVAAAVTAAAVTAAAAVVQSTVSQYSNVCYAAQLYHTETTHITLNSALAVHGLL